MRSDVDLMLNRRVLIVVEPGAEVKMLFCDHTANDRHYLATQVIEAYVGENASLDLYCMEETSYNNKRVSNAYFDQASNSRLTHHVITLHNGVTRNTTSLRFSGEGAECNLYGCVIADKQQHVDNNTLIDHAVPHCTSNELYKYVLDGHSTGAFCGPCIGSERCTKKLVRRAQPKYMCHQRSSHVFTTRVRNICRRREMCTWFNSRTAQ